MCKTYLTWHLHDKTSSNDLKQPHMTANSLRISLKFMFEDNAEEH